MAIDSRQKRESACFFGLTCRPRTIEPDGTISQADRQDIVGFYRGISAEALAVVRVFVRDLAEKYSITDLTPKYLVRFLENKYSITDLDNE